MATRAQIDRLSSRIETLVSRRRDMRYAVIFVDVGEAEHDAIERHYGENPQDRDASNTILVRFVAAKDGRPAHPQEVA